MATEFGEQVSLTGQTFRDQSRAYGMASHKLEESANSTPDLELIFEDVSRLLGRISGLLSIASRTVSLNDTAYQESVGIVDQYGIEIRDSSRTARRQLGGTENEKAIEALGAINAAISSDENAKENVRITAATSETTKLAMNNLTQAVELVKSQVPHVQGTVVGLSRIAMVAKESVDEVVESTSLAGDNLVEYGNSR